jgi:hypothetical protein
MADQALNILDRIEETLTTETADGGRLEDIETFFVIRTAADTPPDFGGRTPVLIVSPLTIVAENLSVPPFMLQKTFPVQFSLLTENTGNTEDTTAASLIDAVFGVFFQDSLSVADWWDFVSIDYSQVTLPGFAGAWNGQAEFICQYTYVDVRECEVATNTLRRSISNDTEVTAASTLSVGYDTLRIYGDVTLTSTPTIYAGRDGQRITIIGTSDTLIPILQDENILPGSTLKMQQQQNFILGLNDSITFEYNENQGAWIEVGRADVY